jgi:hypothetical protein
MTKSFKCSKPLLLYSTFNKKGGNSSDIKEVLAKEGCATWTTGACAAVVSGDCAADSGACAAVRVEAFKAPTTCVAQKCTVVAEDKQGAWSCLDLAAFLILLISSSKLVASKSSA